MSDGLEPTFDDLDQVINVGRAVALRFGANIHEADEVAQQTVIKLWSRWHYPNLVQVRSSGPASWRSYVAATAKNVHLDQIKSNQRRHGRINRAAGGRQVDRVRRPGTVALEAASASEAEDLLARLMIIDEIGRLPGKQHAIAYMIIVLGMTAREVSEKWGIQPQSVRKHLRAARATLQDRLSER